MKNFRKDAVSLPEEESTNRSHNIPVIIVPVDSTPKVS